MTSQNKQHDDRLLQKLLGEARTLIENAPDNKFSAILGNEIARLLVAIAPPKTDNSQSMYDYLLTHKSRLAVIAQIHQVIVANHTLPATVNGVDCRVSPFAAQWFDDGVLFVQGAEAFGGVIGLYQDGKVKFALAARDIPSGQDSIGKDDLVFVNVEEASERINQRSFPKSLPDLIDRVHKLERLLASGEDNEAEYQVFLQKNAWCFGGGQYKQIDSHRAMDDANVPDFTGVRVKDSARDILEIKQPFLSLFKQDGNFRNEFHSAYSQVERYLDLARTEVEYLHRQKGLIFDNPHCYLLVGFNLSPHQIKMLRRKEKMNPAITILTYNDLLAMARNTVELVRALKEPSRKSADQSSLGDPDKVS